MVNIDTFIFNCPYFIGSLPEHNEIKESILEAIDEIGEPIVNESEGVNITKSDWNVGENVDRRYLDILEKPITKYMVYLTDKIGFGSYVVHNAWFQQYKKGSEHNWHVHLECQWTNVYFLELPEDAPKTLLISPHDQKTIIEVKVKEGDILTIPGFMIHKAPMIESDLRKTIISYNCSMNLTPKVLEYFYNF